MFEVDDDSLFLDEFLALISEHDNPKLISAIDSHGQPLDHFKVLWAASLAEEVGQSPMISVPSKDVTYFIFFSHKTKLTGYLSFYPINH